MNDYDLEIREYSDGCVITVVNDDETEHLRVHLDASTVTDILALVGVQPAAVLRDYSQKMPKAM